MPWARKRRRAATKGLGLSNVGQVGLEFPNNALICLTVMIEQILDQIVRDIPLARAMTDDHDPSADRRGMSDLFIKGGFFQSPLTLFSQLILMHEIMQAVMRIVGSGRLLRDILRGDIDLENPGPMMVNDDQEIRRRRRGMRGSLRGKLASQADRDEEMSNVFHLGACELFAIGFLKRWPSACDFEHELVVGLAVDHADFLDQGDDVSPFAVVRRGMMEDRLDSPTMNARCHGKLSQGSRWLRAVGG
jgi:hypothetical protein